MTNSGLNFESCSEAGLIEKKIIIKPAGMYLINSDR